MMIFGKIAARAICEMGHRRGISIIGAVFTMIILGIFGTAIVSLMSAGQEMRVGQLSEDWAFYTVQAGLEYAIGEIDRGGYPVVSGKSFSHGNFTVGVNYDEASNRQITATANVGAVQKSHEISYDSFGADCLEINREAATLTGPNKSELKGITLKRICNEVITIDKMMLSWEVDGGEKFTRIKIKGDTVWEDVNGAASGSIVDIVDTVLEGSISHQVNVIQFNSNMEGKTLTIRFIMTDTSRKTIVLQLLPSKK